jgi:glycosyltransferase 2 family protein
VRPRVRTGGRLGGAVRVGFLVVAVGLLVLALRDGGDEALAAVRAVGVPAALGSLLAVLAGLLASALVWRALLADMGTRLALRPALHVFFLGQLGKYLPGSVFAIAAQMELGRDHGAPRSRVGAASLVFMGVLVAVGLLTAAAALPLTSPDALRQFGWVLAVLPVGLLCLAPPVLSRLVGLLLRLLRREPLDRPLSARGVGAAVGWALVMWLLYGVHLWLLVLPQGAELAGGAAGVPLLALGAYALAWTAGFLFVVAPAGAVVRETALVVALLPLLDRSAGLAVAVLSRALMTVGDLLWGAAGAALRPPRGAGVTDVTTVADVKQARRAADR